MASKQGYLGNPFLKQIGEQIGFTKHQLQEYAKCQNDVVYFLTNYGKIVSLDKGIVPFKPFPFQIKLLSAIQNNRKVCSKQFRQSGKSTTLAGYIAWYVLFNPNKNAAVLANKMVIAKEIFSRVQFIIESCPKWLQQGVKEWNKTSLVLENGSKCFCAATSPSAVRGMSINLILLDEFAHISPSLADEFMASVFPTISSSEESKLIIVSTPKGMNHFFKIWKEAEQGINGFVPIESHWSEHPNRTKEWADAERVSLGEVRYAQEIECNFSGSSFTLIAGHKLSSIPFIQPLPILIPFLSQYELPIKNNPATGEKAHSYVMTVDVARGANLDYSTFIIYDISVLPYNIVAVYRNNTISTMVYPEVIMKVCMWYNDAYCLIETNDLGQQVADTLFYDLEYENVYMSIKEDIKEGGSKSSPGIRTTKRTKAIGCDALKNIVENDKITLNDSNILDELSTFVRVGNSYKAEDTKHDDLAMCLVIFSHLTTQPVFKELFTYDLRKNFVGSQLREIDDQFLPIGFVDNGIDEMPMTEEEMRGPRPEFDGWFR